MLLPAYRTRVRFPPPPEKQPMPKRPWLSFFCEAGIEAEVGATIGAIRQQDVAESHWRRPERRPHDADDCRGFPPPPERQSMLKGSWLSFFCKAGIEAKVARDDRSDKATGRCRQPLETARKKTSRCGRLQGIPATSTICKKKTHLSRVILWIGGFSFSPCIQRVSAVLTSFRNLSPVT